MFSKDKTFQILTQYPIPLRCFFFHIKLLRYAIRLSLAVSAVRLQYTLLYSTSIKSPKRICYKRGKVSVWKAYTNWRYVFNATLRDFPTFMKHLYGSVSLIYFLLSNAYAIYFNGPFMNYLIYCEIDKIKRGTFLSVRFRTLAYYRFTVLYDWCSHFICTLIYDNSTQLNTV